VSDLPPSKVMSSDSDDPPTPTPSATNHTGAIVGGKQVSLGYRWVTSCPPFPLQVLSEG